MNSYLNAANKHATRNQKINQVENEVITYFNPLSDNFP